MSGGSRESRESRESRASRARSRFLCEELAVTVRQETFY